MAKELDSLAAPDRDDTLTGGGSVNEAYFEKLSDAAAGGDYPGEPGEWLVRPQGRPKLCNKNPVSVTFKMPRSQYDALSKKAKSLNKSRSEYLQRAVARDLGAIA